MMNLCMCRRAWTCRIFAPCELHTIAVGLQGRAPRYQISAAPFRSDARPSVDSMPSITYSIIPDSYTLLSQKGRYVPFGRPTRISTTVMSGICGVWPGRGQAGGYLLYFFSVLCPSTRLPTIDPLSDLCVCLEPSSSVHSASAKLMAWMNLGAMWVLPKPASY